MHTVPRHQPRRQSRSHLHLQRMHYLAADPFSDVVNSRKNLHRIYLLKGFTEILYHRENKRMLKPYLRNRYLVLALRLKRYWLKRYCKSASVPYSTCNSLFEALIKRSRSALWETSHRYIGTSVLNVGYCTSENLCIVFYGTPNGF